MRVSLYLIPALLVLFFCVHTIPANSAGAPAGSKPDPEFPTIVTVDVQQLLTNSKAAQSANQHLEQVQAVLQKGLDDMKEELNKRPEETRQQELTQGLAALQRQMDIERRAALEVVAKHMNAQIEAWQKVRTNTFVISKQALLSSPASADITADIMARMDAGEVTFANLPKVTIRQASQEAAQKDNAAQKSAADKK